MFDINIIILKAQTFALVFLIASLLVIVAIALDLWDRIYTQRKTSGRIRSHKIRVTIDKTAEYWRFLLIGFLVDCLGLMFSFYKLPFAVILFATGLMCIEAKSMIEHARERKSHIADLPTMIERIIACATEQDARRLIKELGGQVSNLPKNRKC